MLCPEVWSFDPPSSSFSSKVYESYEDLLEVVRNHCFIHCVSLTLPNTLQMPNEIINTILKDNQYYTIKNFELTRIFNKGFINNFVKEGQLTALGNSTNPELNDSFAFTPDRKIILSLCRKTYQELGVQGISSSSKSFMKKNIIIMDLSSDSEQLFRKYKAIIKKLTYHIQIYFDIILSWEPNDSKIHPGAIGSYLLQNESEVRSCNVEYKSRHSYNVEVPVFDDESDALELLEWLGAFSLQCNVPYDNYLSTMKFPEKHVIYGQVVHLQFKGLFTVSRIQKLINEIRNYVVTKSSCWLSCAIQSFEDSFILKKNNRLTHYIGDHLHTIIFKDKSPTFLFSSSGQKINY